MAMKITDLINDPNNFNRHTDYGKELLKKSVDKVGVIEAITISSDGFIISGNARKEIFESKFNEVEVVEIDGSKPIVLKRNDIKYGTKEFYEAAILANTVSKHNIDLDVKKIEEVSLLEEVEIEELGVPKLREIIGNDYEVEREVNNEDYIILYLSKRHLEKLKELCEKFDLEDAKSVLLKLIEEA